MVNSVVRIKGVVQHYSWGGYSFIPQFLKKENPGQKPFAEYWLGAHTQHPSVLCGEDLDLAELIRSNPDILGKAAAKFSSLPFLLKVLDVRQMLSIQVHPDKASAAAGFERENEKGIPMTAHHRSYKDQNHKPEMMVALGDFWLLHGFKDEPGMRDTIRKWPCFHFLLDIFNSKGYRGVYEEVMGMSQPEVDELLSPILEHIIPLYKENKLTRDSEDFWAARAAETFAVNGHYDRGIFSIYFFNLLHLEKGQAVFQPPGMPHAYLEGRNVEVMANSDNVLRAGLTDKHIDVPELMKHVNFEGTRPSIIDPPATNHRIFSTPAEEFELHQYRWKGKDETITTTNAEIWMVMEGKMELKNSGSSMTITGGEAVFITAGTDLIAYSPESAEVFRVTVPA